MGVRGGGSRRPDVLDMAPALTQAGLKPASSSKPPLAAHPDGDGPCLVGNADILAKDQPADPLSLLAMASELLKATPPNCTPTVSATGAPPIGKHGSTCLVGGGDSAMSGGEQDLARDKGLSSEMDQLWKGGAGDMGTNVDDLMQVIKNMESSRPDGTGGGGDEMFPLTDGGDAISSLERALFNDERDAALIADQSRDMLARERVVESQKAQAELERRCARLVRRVWKLQARSVGCHVGEELLGFLEATRRRATPPLSMATMIERLDCVAQRQAVARRSRPAVEPPALAEVGASDEAARRRLRAAASQLRAQLAMVEAEADSDATASSSGGESCDEMQAFNNQHQQHLSISRRAAWRWARDRAGIAGRWTWLQAQISDLEYRIRQHNEIHRQLRASKGGVILGVHPTAVNGLKTAEVGSGARVRPLDREQFRKRKLLQGAGLHLASRKAARPSNTRCRCAAQEKVLAPCMICTGRVDPTATLPLETMSVAERAAVLDPAIHPVLSFPSEVRDASRFAGELRSVERQQKMMRTSLKVLKAANLHEDSTVAGTDTSAAMAAERRNYKLDQQKKYRARLKRSVHNRPLLSKMRVRSLKSGRKSKGEAPRPVHSLSYGEHRYSADCPNDNGSRIPSPEPSTSAAPSAERHAKERRKREDSYDIDNIIIPRSYSSAARVEILTYKEIPTPKWRVVDSSAEADTATARDSTDRSPCNDSDVEDCSDEAIALRHEKSLAEEKKKFSLGLKMPPFLRGRAQRRTDSLAESSGANTPDPMSPAAAGPECESRSGSPLASPPATPQPADADLPPGLATRRRTVSQTRLPLRDDTPLPSPAPADTTPDVFVAPYEKRRFPLSDEAAAVIRGSRPLDEPAVMPVVSSETRRTVSLALPAGIRMEGNATAEDCAIGRLSPCSDSTDSGRDNDDPNDPEWTEKEDRDAERDKLKPPVKR